MPLFYVYFDGLWVKCSGPTEQLLVQAFGGRIEEYGYTPEFGALVMPYKAWVDNMEKAKVAYYDL